MSFFAEYSERTHCLIVLHVKEFVLYRDQKTWDDFQSEALSDDVMIERAQCLALWMRTLVFAATANDS